MNSQPALVCGYHDDQTENYRRCVLRLQSKIADLLQPSQIDAGITLIISILNISCARCRALLLPVNTRTNITVANDDVVCPLDGVLFHLIERRGRIITTIMRIVVVIFAMAVAGNQL